jgi:hypothetical protein
MGEKINQSIPPSLRIRVVGALLGHLVQTHSRASGNVPSRIEIEHSCW